MDRATAFLASAADMTPLALAAGLDIEQVAARALDAAYGQLGFLSSDLPNPPLTVQQGADLPWLTDYYVLRSITRALAVKVDLATADQKRTASQLYKQAAGELARVETALDARGYNTRQSLTLGRLELDFLEPNQGGW